MSWQPGVTLAHIEKETILAALKFYHGNKAHAAQALGVSTKTVYNKLSQYGIQITDAERAALAPKESKEDEPKGKKKAG